MDQPKSHHNLITSVQPKIHIKNITRFHPWITISPPQSCQQQSRSNKIRPRFHHQDLHSWIRHLAMIMDLPTTSDVMRFSRQTHHPQLYSLQPRSFIRYCDQIYKIQRHFHHQQYHNLHSWIRHLARSWIFHQSWGLAAIISILTAILSIHDRASPDDYNTNIITISILDHAKSTTIANIKIQSRSQHQHHHSYHDLHPWSRSDRDPASSTNIQS